MEDYLINNGYNYDGTNSDNKIAKSLAATIYWTSDTHSGVPGNTDYTNYRNKTGFTAIPSGYIGVNGTFYNLGLRAVWWSTTNDDTDNVWVRDMSTLATNVIRNRAAKRAGFTVRCLKD
jgi:uncharacterized protein (TIGR02145 family)